MARKFLYLIAFVIVVVVGVRIALTMFPAQLSRAAFTPSGQFEAQPTLAGNAYADPKMWQVRPGAGLEDLRKWTPEGFSEDGPPLDVAVFWVHPTSYLKKAHWNAPLDDADARRIADVITRADASVFGRAIELWSPRYRQATFGAFVSDKPQARQALDLAYGDIAQAFDAFIASQPANRPIVLAGHSQGSYLIKRLLRDKLGNSPVAKRIVAVYALGWVVDIDRDLAPIGLAPCAAPDQVHCVISFLSFTDDADTAMMRDAYRRFATEPGANGGKPNYLCSNPLTGGIGGTAPASVNRGGIVPDAKLQSARITPGLVGANCAADGSLRIGAGPDMGPFVLPGGNYHVYDYALYWTNLRQDFAQRMAAWPRTR